MERVVRTLLLSVVVVLLAATCCLAQFTNISAGITPLAGAAAWGDFDKDGDLDLAIAGTDGTSSYAKIYRRESTGAFVDIGAPLPAVSDCALAWGDCDNDGDLDLAIAGAADFSSVAKIYINNGGTFTENTSASLYAVTNCSLAWGDYDRDGRLDLIVCGLGEIRNSTRLYHNNGDGTYTYVSTGITGVSNGSVAWGDVNNDGYLDIAIAGSGLTTGGKIYRNNGDGTFTSTATILGVTGCSLAFGDYDNDGDLDIAIAGAGSLINSAYTRLYNNDGTGRFTLDSTTSFTGVKNSSVAWGDYDNDGDADLAISGVNGGGTTYYTKVYRNNGGGAFVDSSSGLPGCNNGTVAWGDFDADKRIDLAIVGKNSFGYLGGIYQNTGSVYNTAPTAPFANNTAAVGQNGEVTFTWTASTDSQTPAAGLSYNVRIGTYSLGENVMGGMSSLSGTTIYRRVPAIGNAQKNLSITVKGLQPSTVYRWAVQAIDSAFTPSSWSNEAYFNTTPMISGRVTTAKGAPIPGVVLDGGNGYTATTDSNGYYKLFMFKYATGTVTASKAGCTFSPASRPYSNLTAHLFNQDFTGSWAGTFTEMSQSLEGMTYGTISWADYDRDGDYDLFLCGFGTTIARAYTALFRNDSGAFNNSGLTWTQADGRVSTWGDYNNDNYPDLTYSYQDGNWFYYRLYNNSGGSSFSDVSTTPRGANSIAWADYDKDGDLDSIRVCESYGALYVEVYENAGGVLTDTGLRLQIKYEGRVAAGDFDNDGDIDLSAGTFLYRNDGGVYTPVDAGLTYNQYGVWGDYDGDGDLDLATGTAIYRNDGNWTFTDVHASVYANYEPASGDVDNDGDMDLALGTGAGTGTYRIVVLRSDPGDVFTEVMVCSGSVAECLAWADYDGDGDLDLAASRKTSTGYYATKIFRNDGGILNVPPSAPTGLSATQSGLDITFSWAAAADTETPAAAETYNLRVGTGPGKADLFQGMVTDTTAVRMLRPGPGALGFGRSRTLRLLPGTYYWSVQTVDSSFAPSPWATEQTVNVTGTTIIGRIAKGSGAAVAGVTVTPDNGAIGGVTSATGDYTVYVPYNWSGTLTPSVDKFVFSPAIIACTVTTGPLTGQNFTAIPYPVISGIVAHADGTPIYAAHVAASGVPGDYTTGTDGYYQLTVPYDWTGTVTVTDYCVHEPDTHSYTGLKQDVPIQDFVASGFLDIAAGLPGSYAVGFADYDNDDDMDILAGTWDTAKMFRNDGGGIFSPTATKLYTTTRNAVKWADFNNDGFADLFRSGSIYLNDGAGGFVGSGTGLPGITPEDACIVDVDHDGLVDVVECGWSSGAYIWVMHNNGNGTFTQLAAIVTDLNVASLDCADYDNDGDIDIAIQGWQGGIMSNMATKIYRNDGPGIYTDIKAGLIGYANGAVAWGDYDNDGDFDLAVAGAAWYYFDSPYKFRNGCVEIYRNDGGDTFSRLVHYLAPLDADIAWADMDNDGHLDLWMVGDYNRDDYVATPVPGFNVMRNLGGDSFGVFTMNPVGLALPSISVADYNKDGRLDIAISGVLADGTRLTRVCRGTMKNANTPPTAPTGLSEVVNGLDATFSWGAGSDAECPAAGLTYNLRVGTAPGKGDIYSGLASAAGLKRIGGPGNVGKSLTWRIYHLPPGQIYWSVQSVDVGWAGSAWATERSVTISGYKISGKVTSFDGKAIASAAVSASNGGAVAMTDSSGAYSLNVPVGWSGYVEPKLDGWYFTPTRRVYTNVNAGAANQDFTGNKLTDSGTSLTGYFWASAAWADYDNDGDQDVVVSGIANSSDSGILVTKILRNDSGVLNDTGAAIVQVLVVSFAWCDYDNDGDLDLALSGNTASDITAYVSKLYRNDAGTFVDTGAALPTGVCRFAWGDYNNDGRADLAVCASLNNSNGTYVTKVYRNQGSSLVDSGVVLPTMFGDIAWGDYDSDGDLDLALCGIYDVTTQGTKIMRNDGGSFVDIGVLLESRAATDVEWIDIDGDGRLDISATVDHDGPRLYHNDGGGSFTPWGGKVGLDAAWNLTSYGDFDNDGFPDLCMTSRLIYTPMLYKNNRDGTFTSTGISSIPFTGCNVWADYDGDMDVDLLLMGETETDYKMFGTIYKTTGPGNTRPVAPSGLSSVPSGTTITFSWGAGSDAETPGTCLTYNLRVGTAPGKDDIFCGMADTSTGYRRLQVMGNVQRNMSWTINGLDPTKVYYWNVQTIDSQRIGSAWAPEQAAGNVDTTPPSLSAVAVSPAMVKGGDLVKITVDATDTVGVTSVTANGTPLAHTSGNTWQGNITALSDLGPHDVNVTARDAAGNTKNAVGSYKTCRVVGTSTKNAPGIPLSATGNFLFTFWGRAALVDANNFTVDDGSGQIVKVVMPGYSGITNGRLLAVRGVLNPLTTPPTVTGAIVTLF